MRSGFGLLDFEDAGSRFMRSRCARVVVFDDDAPARGRGLGRRRPLLLSRRRPRHVEASPVLEGVRTREQRAAAKVEPVPRGQGVQDGAAHHDRTIALPAIGVGLDVGAVHRGHGAAAEHVEHVIGRDHRAGVLVDADPEERRRLRHEREEPADPAPLLEVLIDHHALDDPEPGREVHHPVLRGRTRLAEGDHVRGEGGRARARPREHDAPVVGVGDGVAHARPGDDLGQPRLVPAGEEHAGRAESSSTAAGSSASCRSSGRIPLTSHAESLEQLAVGLGGRVAERGRGRDHDHVAVAPPASSANVERIALSRKRSSAPPMIITGPAPPTARRPPVRHGGKCIRRRSFDWPGGQKVSGRAGRSAPDRPALAGSAGRGARPRPRSPRGRPGRRA